MPPRLEHEGAPQPVEALPGEAALLEDGRARDRVEAARDHPERLAGRVRLDSEKPPP
jgi:hypothetical protein